MTSIPQGGELAELVLARASAHDCQVIVTETAHLDQRWAVNSATTNGSTSSTVVTVILTEQRDGSGDGRAGTDVIASASCSASLRTRDDIAALVDRARHALTEARNAETAPVEVAGVRDADFFAQPAPLPAEDIAPLLDQLGSINERLAGQGIESFGYLEREQSTVWLASSRGLRRRDTSLQDRLEFTAKSDQRRRSTWHGQATLNLPDADVLVERIRRQLDWQGTHVDVQPGRHTVVLTPSAVADLSVDLLWSSGARDAAEGRTALHDPHRPSSTKVGELICDPRVTLASNPRASSPSMMACTPFALTPVSSRYASVLDNGRDLGAQVWIDHGQLRCLHGPTSDAVSLGVPVAPTPGNLLVEVAGGTGDLDDLVATVEDGLLITCLWYIRSVDPQTMTVTGLTRDGVYRVREGMIVGAAPNFRFNDSPLGLLSRLAGATEPQRTLPREMADYANRTTVPAMVVRDFHLTSLSDAI